MEAAVHDVDHAHVVHVHDVHVVDHVHNGHDVELDRQIITAANGLITMTRALARGLKSIMDILESPPAASAPPAPPAPSASTPLTVAVGIMLENIIHFEEMTRTVSDLVPDPHGKGKRYFDNLRAISVAIGSVCVYGQRLATDVSKETVLKQFAMVYKMLRDAEVTTIVLATRAVRGAAHTRARLPRA